MDMSVAGDRANPLARVRDQPVTVAAIEDLTRWYRRLTFDAPGLFADAAPLPGAYCLLGVPDLAGTNQVQRAYTLLNVTPTGFCLDFVLHSPPGPGCAWAARARAGETAAVSLPPYMLRLPAVPYALLIGDATAIPALWSISAALGPAVGVTTLIAEARADREQIGLPPGARWVDSLDTAMLAGAAGGVDPADCFLWAAGERRLAKAVREFARSQFPVPREHQHIQTYWIAGEPGEG